MPEKDQVKWIPREDVLEFDEIARVARVLAGLGIDRIRITGGEPLLRPNLEKLVATLSALKGIREVDMTTNGWFLAKKARALKQAGLRGVTVSLHSLRRDRFAKISGVDALPKVLEGIDAASREGLSPLKINSVAIRGYNDDEILDLVGFARERGISIRFIEFMPLDGLGIWKPELMVSGKEIVEGVSRKHKVKPKGRGQGNTAAVWEFEDGMGELGVITPMTEPFCDDCDRIRLSSDGKLLSCLFDTNYYDLKDMLRNEVQDEELAQFIVECVSKKPDGVGYMPWVKNAWEKPRSMYAIGG
jgi:cyclic pyranopterin phosphate synthase